ncbi:DUF721 domain-containing protein [Candidatus Babeliales bacterium]|nr:DUF721 domain-containing protein [Candidatus Babeliales bacterium]
MNHISAHVSDILQKKNVDHYWKFTLMHQWNQIMGNLANKVFIYKIHNNQITLGVCDSSWMQELYLLSGLIQEKINLTLGCTKIEKIKFKYAPNNQMVVKKIQKDSPTYTHVQHLLSNSESAAIAKITDQELAQALLGFLQRCHQFS